MERIPRDEIHRYGVIAGTEREPRTYEISDMVEKPPPGTAPSDLAIIGRYVLPPEIFSILEHVQPGAGGEIQLTDGLKIYASGVDFLATNSPDAVTMSVPFRVSLKQLSVLHCVILPHKRRMRALIRELYAEISE